MNEPIEPDLRRQPNYQCARIKANKHGLTTNLNQYERNLKRAKSDKQGRPDCPFNNNGIDVRVAYTF